jgi:hypothetical protein
MVVAPPKSTTAIQFFYTHSSVCWPLHRSSKQIIHLLQDISGLTDFQKHTLITRYISVTESISRRSIAYAYLFHIGRTIVSVGSLIVPALLSIQYTTNGSTDSAPLAMQIYWVTWFISLLVTMFNGILAVFKVDKKYYFLHTIHEHLQSELWQYIYLSGKYGGHYTKSIQSTHANQYVFVCHNLEKIKLKQVEEEYYKLLESSSGSNNDKHTIVDLSGSVIDPSKMVAGMYTPTPNQNQLLEKQMELAKALGLTSANTLHPIQGAVINEKAATTDTKATSQSEGRRTASRTTTLSV